jgi:hypothetical protein
MIHKILGLIAIILTVWALYPYIRSIHQGKTKPHAFSWIIWGSTTMVVGIAQFTEKGGAGSWSIILSGTITFYIAYLAYIHKSDTSITRSDTLFFVSAMSAIPFWIITSNPLWSVLILTSVDIIGYAPTFRKSYENPYQESLPLFSIMTFRNFIAALALEHYSLTTLVFPVATGLANVVLIGMIFIRRRFFLLD